MDEAQPISYQALTVGTPVLSATGTQLGTVEHILADDNLDVFDGIVLRTADGIRFVTADSVGSITTAAVQTTITDTDAADLPKPDSEDVFHADGDEDLGDSITARFGRLFRRDPWKRDN